jgi:LytS/YehU family sensor histidine kinase
MRPEDLPLGERPPPGPEAGRPVLFDALTAQARMNLPIYWIIVSIAQALTHYRRAQERERRAIELEARLTEARLDALRMQLHPHFLFNTLHAISTLVHKDPNAADEMIGNLSELLRAALDTSDRQEVTLGEELSFLDHFLEIQQTRFGERLRVERQVDTALLAAYVPTLILQPLVENAIRHGVEPHPGPGVIAIAARREGEGLRLTVRDNGAGPKPAAREREGIGLANTRARLEQLYGATARLRFSAAAEGYTAELEIPYHEHPSHTHR